MSSLHPLSFFFFVLLGALCLANATPTPSRPSLVSVARYLYESLIYYIQFNVSNTRSSSYLKLRHSISQNNLQGHFFFNRLPRLWNSLPLLDISLSIPSIRTKLREHFCNHFIAHFDSNNVCTYHYLCPCVNCTKLPVKSLFTHKM